jgi:hypothetical protein
MGIVEGILMVGVFLTGIPWLMILFSGVSWDKMDKETKSSFFKLTVAYFGLTFIYVLFFIGIK